MFPRVKVIVRVRGRVRVRVRVRVKVMVRVTVRVIIFISFYHYLSLSIIIYHFTSVQSRARVNFIVQKHMLLILLTKIFLTRPHMTIFIKISKIQLSPIKPNQSALMLWNQHNRTLLIKTFPTIPHMPKLNPKYKFSWISPPKNHHTLWRHRANPTNITMFETTQIHKESFILSRN